MTWARTVAALLDVRQAIVNEVADELVDDAVERLPSFIAGRHEA